MGGIVVFVILNLFLQSLTGFSKPECLKKRNYISSPYVLIVCTFLLLLNCCMC